MDTMTEPYESLIRSAAQRLKGHQRRLFQAEVTNVLCGGSARVAERRFGWGRECVQTGLHEAKSGVRCVENFAAKGGRPCEAKDPQLAADIRRIVEPHTQADPELKSARQYTNLSAREVRAALKSQKGYTEDQLPKERTMRDILNRMGYRLKRIQKAKPLKKTKDTDAIFDNVQAARKTYGTDPETLEISIDTKAKVSEGEYSRGGKMSDRWAGPHAKRVGPRPAGQNQVDPVRGVDVGHGGVDRDLHVESGDE
jgi:Rhodopirellula transposase DDE domain